MRIALAIFGQIEFIVDTPYQSPLGGSESALCYMAEALAQQGHDVYLLNAIVQPSVSRGVQCLPAKPDAIKSIQPLDALLVKNFAKNGPQVRSLLADKTRLIFWTGHTHDRPDVKALHDPAERRAYDGLVFVSEWQRQNFIRHFGLDADRTVVVRNAIGTSFRNLFEEGSTLLANKSQPPLLAYTSSPNRGLDVLLDVFPEICRAVPGARLKVFSSMQLYQLSKVMDDVLFGRLYRRCRQMEQVDYVGVVPQPTLANEMRSVSLLAYPDTVPESFCIAALEAMAAGCFIVTSDLGALPETTAGFARLIPYKGQADDSYRHQFVQAVIQTLDQGTRPDAEIHLQRQVGFVNESYTWPSRAQQLVQWITTLPPQKA